MNAVLEKPKVGQLVGNSVNFLKDNFALAWACVKPIALPLLFFIIVATWLSVSMQVDIEAAAADEAVTNFPVMAFIGSLLIGVPQFFLIACFVLSWHRMYILGADEINVVNPFAFKQGEFRAVLGFLGVFYMPFALVLIIGGIVGLASLIFGKAGMVVMISLIPVYIYGIIQIMRFTFVLPALAVGDRISLMQARELSKGLLWKFFWGTVLAGLIVMVPAMFIGFITGFVSSFGGETNILPIALTTLVNTIVSFFGLFLYASVLSQLYQWAKLNKESVA